MPRAAVLFDIVENNMRVDLDDEEITAVIDMHRYQVNEAIDSCEYEEADRRRQRIAELEKIKRTGER